MNWEVVPVWRYFSFRKCRILRATWADALTWYSNHDLSDYNKLTPLANWIKHTSHDLPVDFVFGCQTLWQEFIVDYAPHIEEFCQYDFGFWICLTFGMMVMKGYSAFLKFPGLESYHKMQFSTIPRTLNEATLLQGTSGERILQSQAIRWRPKK